MTGELNRRVSGELAQRTGSLVKCEGAQLRQNAHSRLPIAGVYYK